MKNSISLSYCILKRHLLITILLITPFIGKTKTIHEGSINDFNLYIDNLDYLKQAPDTAYAYIAKFYAKKALQNDTISQIKCLLALADIQKIKGNFNEAYDYSWDAQFLSEAKKDTSLLAQSHKILGMLFSLFNNSEQALWHKNQALTLYKNLWKTESISANKLASSYFSIAGHYSRLHQFEAANAYLDTCTYLTERYHLNANYILAERAYIAITLNQLSQADSLLKKASPYFLDNERLYAVMIYSFWGDLKYKQTEYKAAITYYQKCLSTMDKRNVHTDIRPEVLEKIAKIYHKKGMSDKAYAYLSASKLYSDSLFSAKNNSDLLIVKNKYKEAMLRKNLEIAQQQNQLNEKKEQNYRLRTVLGLIIFLFTVTILLLMYRTQRKRHKAQELETAMKAQLEKEKHKEVMEAKNKEITSYTLQLIDKERIIDKLLSEIEKKTDQNTFRRLRNASKDVNKNLWKDFNERFTKVNSDFYKQLLEKHPGLSPTELKHCALIKLNFNGKEMAQLLNISLPSVHLARHRLRKKLGLKREDNLGEVIGRI